MPATTTRRGRPFLKWAGGKTQLLPQYERFFPKEFNAYHEPFLGSGAVFFHLRFQRRPRNAYLSDSNEDLINCYLCIRDHLPNLLEHLQRHQRLHSRTHYYRTRALAPRSSERGEVGRTPAQAVARAARLIYLNKTCYNGLYRLNSKGEFNVPMGRYCKPRIADERLLQCASAQLLGVTLLTESFVGVVRRARAGDFVYLDPPYHPISDSSSFTAYAGERFEEEDQRRLRGVFATLTKGGIRTMLSNSDTPLVRELYRDFRVETVTARRAINSAATKRGSITELVVLNY